MAGHEVSPVRVHLLIRPGQILRNGYLLHRRVSCFCDSSGAIHISLTSVTVFFRTRTPPLMPTEGLNLSQCPGDGSRLDLCEAMFLNHNLPAALRSGLIVCHIHFGRRARSEIQSDHPLGRGGGRYSIAESKERASLRCRPRCSIGVPP